MDINTFERMLSKVQKPARYIGGELNSIEKKLDNIDIRFAFCFPDIYEVGMSHLGMKILYNILNKREDIYCERVFAPWADMEEEMKKENISLFSLETKDSIKEFDFVGFTLQYEMSYSNIINMLKLAQIPIYSHQRNDDEPFVIAGGPCAYNSEPIADFIDIVVLGEGEEVILEIMDRYKEWKSSSRVREDFLREAALIEGVYVPSFYNVKYNDDNTIKEIIPMVNGIPNKIRKRIIKDLDNAIYPESFIVPYIEIVHDRAMLELFRGCIRGCRFCQAGIIYRPVREKSADVLKKQAEDLLIGTGYDEISLASLSTSDYSQLEDLTNHLLELTEKEKVNLGLPSLRIDSFSVDLMKKAQKVRKSGITFAPEAGTQRLRDVINKGVTEDDLIRSCKTIFEGGWNNVKLYFMIGLPTETIQDVKGIGVLTQKVVDTYNDIPFEKRAKGLKVTVSTSSFVPKPFTPFQWVGQNTIEELEEKQDILKREIKNRKVKYNWHNSKLSILEGVFARGDRRLSKVLEIASEKGCKFDGWNEYFDYDKWVECFKECEIDMNFYNNRERDPDEVLPWDHIDTGVSKSFLIKEYKKALNEELTSNCYEKCSACGANSLSEGCCCV
jgi:radical SAM family uncharacterized protein